VHVLGMSAHARKSKRERERECASKNARVSQETEVRDSKRGEREYAMRTQSQIERESARTYVIEMSTHVWESE